MPDFFGAYYPAGKAAVENPNELYQISHSLPNTTDTILGGFVNLPIIAYLFTPFTYFDEAHAGLLFTLLGIVLTLLSVFLLAELSNLKGTKKLLFFAILLINVPVSNSIWIGNTTHFIFILVISSLLCLRKKEDFWSGVLLAAAALIKPPLLFLTLFFIVRKHWRALLGAYLTLLGTVTLSLVFCGWQLNLLWFQSCILAFSGKVVGSYNVQSIDSFLIRLFTKVPLDSWDMYEANLPFKLARYSLFVLFIGASLWMLFKTRHSTTSESESLEFSIFLCLAIICSPISWSHYYLLLFLPISLLISLPWINMKKWNWSIPIALVILLISTPPVKNVSIDNPLVSYFMRNFLVSHYFWGGVLLVGILLAARWRYNGSFYDEVIPSKWHQDISKNNGDQTSYSSD
jgi:hypothetical protein